MANRRDEKKTRQIFNEKKIDEKKTEIKMEMNV